MSSESLYFDGIHVLSYRQPSQPKKTILFVHGSWHGSWCWDEYFMPYFFSKGYNCYAVDLRAHGLSKPKADWKMNFISLSNYVEDVQKVIESLPDQNFTLVGHSMGGIVLQKFLQKNHPKVSSAVLMAPATPGGVLSNTIYMMVHHPIIYMQIALSYYLFLIVKNFKVFKEIFFHSETDEERLRAYHAKMQNESYRVYLNMMFARINYNIIKTKVLILAAENDVVFPPVHMRNLAKKLNCELKFFPDTGHDIMLEKEWEKAAESIDRFIKS